LYIIPFLSRLREVSNEAGLSEGMLLRILPDLMIEPALTAFRSAHPISYPVAVRRFLLTYAPESSVAEYWRRLQQSRQAESETPNEFALRLKLEASKLGCLVYPQELKGFI
jgi:membrane-anchored protein YejM (alkaline phosphatase superfamily)